MTWSAIKQLEKTPPLSFFPSDSFYLTARMSVTNLGEYEARKTDSMLTTETVHLQIKKVVHYDYGTVYKLIIPKILHSDNYLSDDRIIIYFYVTPDKIYRLWGWTEQDGRTIEFYNNDRLLIRTLNTEEKFIANGYIVFQNGVKPDTLQDGARGEHKIITIRDERILSRYWRLSTPDGDTNFYEDITWNLNRGLTAYRSGFRAGADIIYLNNIKAEK